MVVHPAPYGAGARAEKHFLARFVLWGVTFSVSVRLQRRLSALALGRAGGRARGGRGVVRAHGAGADVPRGVRVGAAPAPGSPPGCFGIVIPVVLRDKLLQNFSAGGFQKNKNNQKKPKPNQKNNSHTKMRCQ